MIRPYRRFALPALVGALALSGCADTPVDKPAGGKEALPDLEVGSKSGAPEAVVLAQVFTAVQVDDPASKTIAQIGVGEARQGTLDSLDPRTDDGSYYDLWELRIPAEQDVEIQLNSSAFDPYLVLTDGAPGQGGAILASDDDGGEGLNSLLQGTIRPATYTLVVKSYGSGATGSYTLSVAGSGGSGVRGVAAGQSVSGQLTDSSPTMRDGTPYELWQFQGNAGDQVTVSLSSGDFDTFLRFAYGPSFANAETIGTDDDGGEGLNSLLTVTLPETGTYWIVANAYSTGARGRYDISVQAQNMNWAQRYPGGGDPRGKYAVVVGIDDYPGTANDLRGPVEDATLVRDVLVQRFGFPAQNVVFLRDGDATREGIANAIVRHLGQAGPDGTAVFFYSGHGTQMPDNRGLTGRFDPESENGVDEALAVHGGIILDDEFGYLLQQLQARNTLVVIDACFSGTATRGADFMAKFVDPAGLSDFRLPKAFITTELGPGLGFGGGVAALEQALSNPDRHILMASSSEQQVSWTVRSWPDRTGPASLFTYYWAKVMRNVPTSTTFQQVHAMVSDSVNAMVRRSPNLETQTTTTSGPGLGTSIGTFLRID